MDRHGVVFDYFDGRKDIENKTLRFVGKPSRRIEEDYLRILRLIRFVSQLGFKVEASSKEAIAELTSGLQNLSGERIWSEVQKTLLGSYAPQALELMFDSGITEALFGEFGGDKKRTAFASAWTHENQSILLWGRVAVFFPTKKSLETWKMTSKDKKEILSFVNSVSWLGKSTKFTKEKLGLELDELLGFESVVGAGDVLCWAQALEQHGLDSFSPVNFEELQRDIKTLEPLRTKHLPVDGNDILQAAKNLKIKVEGKSIGYLFRILRSGYYMGHWQSKIDGLRVLKTLLEDGEYETI